MVTLRTWWCDSNLLVSHCVTHPSHRSKRMRLWAASWVSKSSYQLWFGFIALNSESWSVTEDLGWTTCAALCFFWNHTCAEMLCKQLHVCNDSRSFLAWHYFLHSQHPAWCPETTETDHLANVSATLFELVLFEMSADSCRSPTMGAVASGAEHVAKLCSRSNECSRGVCPQ